ncbi:hypothetical protein LEP1GSC050_0099 [Leptospira phage vB_LbrZ_5399-LE1]|uniref:Uncharacterized protein n=1 Tax=Leptospira inadai serovar Lyme TaxID=293084 RepID=A0ABX4YH22_9LEPT|nr:hypothetical protein [Leptospira inadai]AGS80745.1 hypothetical protein LEP1GSC050_0099 [Leptospira phage vB_LbrZ_5399-LE1]AGS80784.1 hypothetical protein LEP1GSC047_0873 [Leptospira phage vB_LinZ_10-LE1]PNV74357.1 hypothetical protein BES34_014330 [Leptospira inadai serovar Lyme]
MSSEELVIKVKGKPDFKAVTKAFEKIAKKAKKGIAFRSSNKPGKKSTSRTGHEKPESAGSYYSKGGKFAHQSGAEGSDLDETRMGGFYGVIDRKIEAFKELSEKTKKKGSYSPNEPSAGDSIGESLGNFSSSKGLKANEAKISIQTAHIDSKKFTGFGEGGNGGGGSTGPTIATGSTTSSAANSMPYLGVPLAIAAGMLKTISSVAERHTQSVLSQSGTYAATGGYVSGGLGYFKNSEIAQANVAKARVSGEGVYGKTTRDFDEKTLKFAAAQGKGITEVVQELETLRKENKNIDLGLVRGSANSSGFSNLRQSEFLNRLSSLSETLRSQGYSGDTSDFMKFSASISQDDSKMDPSRRFNLAEELSNKGRQGVFGGGVFGALSFANSLKENGNDFFSALKSSEKNPGKYMSSALSGLDPKTRGLLSKLEGGSFTEFENLKLNPKDISRDDSLFQARSMKALELGNRSETLFSGKAGERAAEIGHDINEKMLTLFEKHENTFANVASAIGKVERFMTEKISGQLDSLITTGEKLANADLMGAVKEMASAFVGLVDPFGLLVRSK